MTASEKYVFAVFSVDVEDGNKWYLDYILASNAAEAENWVEKYREYAADIEAYSAEELRSMADRMESSECKEEARAFMNDFEESVVEI